MEKHCFNCERKGQELYGYIICEPCKKELRLFTDNTVEKYVSKFTKQGYKKDVEQKLEDLEKIYIKKKIKLLDILTKIN